MEFVPKKLYYKIREVCEIVGVPAHVLRFWETEFPSLAPPKSRSGQRTYRPADIELLLAIRKLLYDDGYTIAGARRRLGTRRSPASAGEAAIPAPARPVPPPPQSPPSPVPPHPPVLAGNPEPRADRLKRVQSELENILTLLDRE